MSAATPTTADLDPGRRAHRGCARAPRAPGGERLARHAPRLPGLRGRRRPLRAPVAAGPRGLARRPRPPRRRLRRRGAGRVRVGSGFAVPTQVVFVPMLFLLPVGLVPLCVAVGFLLSPRSMSPGGGCTGARPPGGVQRLALLGPGARPRRGRQAHRRGRSAAAGPRAPRYSSPSTSPAPQSERATRSTSPLSAAPAHRPVYLVDAALAGRLPLRGRGLRRAVRRPAHAPAPRPLRLLRQRHRRIDHALELNHAYRGTAFLLGDVIEADDAYTGSHSRDVVELVVGVSAQLGLDARSQQAPRPRPCTTWEDPHPRGDHQQAGQADGRGGGDHDPTIEGERMLAQVGGLLGRVGHLVRSCHELGQEGLSGQARRRGHPPRGADRLRLRRVQRDDHRRPYRAARSPRRRSTKRVAGHAVRPEVVRALRRSWPAALAGRPGQPAVFEHAPARLALRAVEDRAPRKSTRDRRPAVGARLAEAVVHLVGSLVRRAGQAELEAGRGLPDRRGEALDLLVGELGRQGVRRELRAVEDLVRPRPADARQGALVAQERMQAARIAAGDLRQLLAVISSASGPRWASSASSSSGR